MESKLAACQCVEQRDVLYSAAAFRVEQVAPHRPARRLVSVDPDEAHAPVTARHIAFRQGLPDSAGIAALPVEEIVPHTFLRRMVVGDGEGLQGFKIEVARAVGREYNGRHTRQRQALPDGQFRHAEADGDFGGAIAFLEPAPRHASNWSAGCMATRTTFSARLSSVSSGPSPRSWQETLAPLSSVSGFRQPLQSKVTALPGDDCESALRGLADQQRVNQPVRRNRRREFVKAGFDSGLADVALP